MAAGNKPSSFAGFLHFPIITAGFIYERVIRLKAYISKNFCLIGVHWNLYNPELSESDIISVHKLYICVGLGRFHCIGLESVICMEIN